MDEQKDLEPQESQIVDDKAVGKISDLWKDEDYWSIWLAFILLIVGVIIFFNLKPEGLNEKITAANTIMQQEAQRAPFKTIAWHQALDQKMKLKAVNSSLGKKIMAFVDFPHGWSTNPLQTFFMSEKYVEAAKVKAQEKYVEAQEKEVTALEKGKEAEQAASTSAFQNQELNDAANTAVDNWRKTYNDVSSAKKKISIESYNQIPNLIALMFVLALFFGIGLKIMGHSLPKFLIGFCFVFFIAVLSFAIENNTTMKHYGISYAAWAILFGIIISNTVGTPKWVMPAIKTEFFIKTGLVLLGAEILFGKVLSISIPGIFVAWLVAPTVLVVSFIYGKKVLKIPSDTLNITISSALAVCGVSASIATAAACRAKKEELTLAVGLSLIFTVLMMIFMPAFIKAVDMPFILGGAWLGGTIDSTGAVAAASAFLSDRALYVAATIKMIQNLLIGVVAFFVALYWCTRIECRPGQKVSWMEIWYRFPKFALGFVLTSVLFSILYEAIGKDFGYVLIDQGVIQGLSKNFREWLFCLAFASIGLETNFRELKGYLAGGKPLILYLWGQSLNLILTLIVAYLMFYVIFTGITAKI